MKDGILDEVLEMPSESGLPITLALVVSVVFIMLLTSHFILAAVFVGIALLTTAAWHLREPAEA